MSELLMAATGLAAVNLLLALALAAVYVRNHAALRSPFTLGLLVFSAFVALHNGMEVYHAATMMMGPSPGDEPFVLLENVLQLGGLGALMVATMR
jgi:hypothetical protein